MSSTNRNKVRNDADYYVTPLPAICLFYNEIIKHEPDIFKGKILDPCAGGDEKNPMSYPTVMTQFNIEDVTTLDIRDNSPATIKGNYLETNFNSKFDCIVTNPPFNLAQEFIEKAIADVVEGGFVIMLLRLNFFGSKKRKEFWEKHPPKYAFVHRERLSFLESGARDSIEYMHCVWQKGYTGEFINTKII
jgi:hypothetical protein